jgi:hypothetical protein
MSAVAPFPHSRARLTAGIGVDGVDVDIDDDDEDVSSPLAVVVVPLPSFPHVLNPLGSTTTMTTTTTQSPPSKPYVVVPVPPYPSPPTYLVQLNVDALLDVDDDNILPQFPPSPSTMTTMRSPSLPQCRSRPSLSLSLPHHRPLGSMTAAKTTPLTPPPLLLRASTPIKHTGP